MPSSINGITSVSNFWMVTKKVEERFILTTLTFLYINNMPLYFVHFQVHSLTDIILLALVFVLVSNLNFVVKEIKPTTVILPYPQLLQEIQLFLSLNNNNAFAIWIEFISKILLPLTYRLVYGDKFH
jgi:hypothetical protein